MKTKSSLLAAGLCAAMATGCADGSGEGRPAMGGAGQGTPGQADAGAAGSWTTGSGGTGSAGTSAPTGVDGSGGGAGGSVAGTSGGGGNGGSAGVGNAGMSGGGAGVGNAGGSGGVAGIGNAGMSGGGAGVGSAGGSGGSAGAGAVSPSAGCSLPAGQTLNSWVEQPTLTVNGKARQWWVWLPTGYDPARAYPLVFTFHGCGGPDNIVPMQKATGGSAILIRGTGITGGCWTYGGTGEDVSFFDAMLADAFAKRCVDRSRVFLTGYSSGSWLVNTLECVRGDKLRATGTVSGGVVNRGTCKGKYARIFLHDADDTVNKFVENGNQAERTRLLGQNHCLASAPPIPEAPAPCARYQGCDAGCPVIMCQTTGKGHDRQDGLAPGAFWGLFSSL
jgi:polyhydroxybutyrate depolymerase